MEVWLQKSPEWCNVGVAQLHYWLWRWRKGSWAGECRQPLEDGKGKQRRLLLEPPESAQPRCVLVLAQWWAYHTSDLQHEIINLCCLKSPGLWSFVTGAIGSEQRVSKEKSDQTCRPLFKEVLPWKEEKEEMGHARFRKDGSVLKSERLCVFEISHYLCDFLLFLCVWETQHQGASAGTPAIIT